MANFPVKLVFYYWPDAIAKPIIHEIRSVITTSNTKILTAGFLIAMFFSSNGIEAIRVALNRAYGGIDTRSLWKLRLQSLLFFLVGAVLMLLISVFLVFVPLYFSFVESDSPAAYDFFYRSDYPSWLSAFGFLIFFVYACHHWLPGRTRSINVIWPGILMTLTLWIIATTCFSLYLKSFANYNATYAGLAGITTAMIFLYLMSAILIFGAEYNSALEKEKLIAN